SATNGLVLLNGADDVDLLAAVHLVPQRLKNLPDRWAFRVAAVHQPRHVFKAHISRQELFMIEHADATSAGFRVAVECEIHFFDAMTLGARTELRLGAWSGAAEKNEVGLVHGLVLPALVFGRVFLLAFFTAREAPPPLVSRSRAPLRGATRRPLARAAGACVSFGSLSPAFSRA